MLSDANDSILFGDRVDKETIKFLLAKYSARGLPNQPLPKMLIVLMCYALFYGFCISINKSSTFLLAHSVLRRNLRLDLIDGF